MHKPSFFAILGLSAIIIASTGYSFLIVGPASDSIIPMTAIVTVCVILGTALVMIGYEVQSLRTLALGRGFQRSSQAGSFPDSGLETPRYPPIMVADESPLEDFKHAPDPAKVDESEQRLEKVRDALKRVSKPVESASGKSRIERGARTRVMRADSRNGKALADAAPSKSFRVSLIGRTEIVLTATNTGEEVKLPVQSAEVLETAWHAFAKGTRVRPIIESGRVTRLEVE